MYLCFYVSEHSGKIELDMASIFNHQKATHMLAFFRENLGIILGIVIFSVVIFGGIYYVEHSLAAQEQVVQ